MSVSRNAAYNFLGSLVPSLVTLITVPVYLHVLGVERYGLLTLCLVIVGYSQFLNTAMSLAVTRWIAQAPENDESVAHQIIWTAIWLAAGLGSFAAVAIYVAAQLYFNEFAVLAPAYDSELTIATLLLALTVPPALLVGALTGALQGKHRFLALNLVGLIGNLFAFVPLALVYFFKPHLGLVMAGTIATQLATLGLLYFTLRGSLIRKRPAGPSKQIVSGLLGFGSRMALITIIVVMFNSVDRLVIGSSLSAAAVPAYAIAYGIISRIISVPHSLSAALFPRFAQVEDEDIPRLTSASILAVASITTPVVVGLVVITKQFFTIWIGPDLTTAAEPIAYALVSGFWFYCLSHMAYSMLQATGRETLVSKVLLFEFVPYYAMLIVCIDVLGVIGAAVAFTVRSAVDCCIFFWLAQISRVTLVRLVPPMLLMAGTTVTAALLEGVARYAILSLLLAASAIWGFLNIPEMLRPYLGKLARFLPAARA